MATNNSVNGWKQSVGAGNPNGVSSGNVGDQYFDTVNFILYQCNASGSTTTALWTAISSIPITYVSAISAANIAGTYNNGTAGVGATLTVTATGQGSADGYAYQNGNLILLASQTNNIQNGLFTVSNQGSTGVNPILTRATTANTPALLNLPQYYKALNGTINVITVSYELMSPVVAIGTTGITYGAVGFISNWISASTTVPFTKGLVPGQLVASASLSGLSVQGSTYTTSTFTGGVFETGWTVQTPVTGFAITLSATQHFTPLNPAGTLATGTITMPTGTSGLRCLVSTTQTISALSVLPDAGHSILGAPTSLRAGCSFEMIYNLATTTWLPYTSAGALYPVTKNLSATTPTALVNNTTKDVITISSLPIGSEWIVDGNVTYVSNTGTCSFATCWISSVSATTPDQSLVGQTTSIGSANNNGTIAPTQILTVGASGSLYLSAQAGFTAGLSAAGNITIKPY